MSTENSSESEEYRLSLISFHGENVDISTWWLDYSKFSLLKVALGDPDVESFYDRGYIEQGGTDALEHGIHVYAEDDDDGEDGIQLRPCTEDDD